MMDQAMIGHNHPPPDDPAAVLAPYRGVISEAELWLDGTPITTEGQRQAVEELLTTIKAAERALASARDAETRPLHDAWKAAVARWKPALDDLERIRRGLLALVEDMRRRLAEAQAEAERRARAEAAAARRAAEEAARQADPADIMSQRAAAEAQAAAEAAMQRAAEVSRARVRGLRTVTRHEVIDHDAALLWIAQHDRDALVAFVDDYARRHAGRAAIDGVRVWNERVAW